MPDRLNGAATHSGSAAHAQAGDRRYGAWLFYAFVVFSIPALVALSIMAHTTKVFSFDVPLTQSMQQFNPPWFDRIMHVLDWIGVGGQAVALICLVIAILYLIGWRWAAVVGAVDAAGIWAVNLLIGHVVGRPYSTPDQFAQVTIHLTKPSFPSGHVDSFIAFYGFMCYLVYTRVTRPWLRIPIFTIFCALIVLVGPSRVYMGQHWPSDVLASIFLGPIWLALMLYVYHRGAQTRFVRERFKDAEAAGK